LKESLKHAAKDHETTRDELKKAQEQLSEIEKIIIGKNNTIEVMKGEIEALKNDLKDRDDRIKSLQDENRLMIDRVIDQKQKQVDAMNQVNELYRTVMIQKQQLTLLQAKYQQSSNQTNAQPLSLDPTATTSSGSSGGEEFNIQNHVLSGASSMGNSRPNSATFTPQQASSDSSYSVAPPKSILFKKMTDSQINAVVFSQDSQILCTAHNDKTVKLWNARSGNIISTLYGSADAVVSVALSSNQQMVAGASTDNVCRIWTVGNGRVRHTLTGHNKKIYATDFTSDCKHVITGSHDRTIKIWEMQYGTCEKTLLKCKSSVNDLEVCPNTPVFCSGHFDACARLWDLRNSYALVHEYTNIHKQQITSVNFSRDGTLLLTAARDNLLQIIDLRTHKILHTLKHDEFRNNVNHNKAVLSPCKSYAMSGSSSGGYLNFIWVLDTEKAITLDGSHKQAVTGCAWAPDGSIVASVSADKQLVVFQ
jgi:autophagy-related protein 16